MLVAYQCRLCGGVSHLAVTDAHLPDGRVFRSVLCQPCVAIADGTTTTIERVG